MLLLHFLRLIRFGNLLVIGVTMCIVQAFIQQHESNSKFEMYEFFEDNQNGPHVGGYQLSQEVYCGPRGMKWWYDLKDLFDFSSDFLLLILSVILIAGAGNIINDYFDIKADRVNKPHKMVVEKHIPRRWAIAWNWIFNILGLAISIYLSLKHDNWWIAIIAFVTINFLWFYSALYKRKIFVGNIIIALLVGLVPLYVLIYNTPLTSFKANIYFQSVDFGTFFVVKVIVIISTIAFVVNFMREIIKDMADIRGDMHLAASTIPISLGIKKTKIILVLLLIPLLMLMAFYVFDMFHMQRNFMNAIVQGEPQPLFINFQWFVLFVALSAFICIISFAFLLSSNTRKRYLLSSNLLKLAMLFGMVSPLFL